MRRLEIRMVPILGRPWYEERRQVPCAPQHTQDQAGRQGRSLGEQPRKSIASPAQLLADDQHENHEVED
jgi:hypothetical protein